MEVQECLGQDATNLLFWTADPAVPAIKLTPNQQFVVLRNPIVRQGGEQD
jgi:hypothetical protein